MGVDVLRIGLLPRLWARHPWVHTHGSVVWLSISSFGKELRRLSLALLVRPQWFHLNRAEGES